MREAWVSLPGLFSKDYSLCTTCPMALSDTFTLTLHLLSVFGLFHPQCAAEQISLEVVGNSDTSLASASPSFRVM